MNTKLHHFAYIVKQGKLPLVIEVFKKLGCVISYQEKGTTWCMLEQKSIPVDIQIIEFESPELSEKIKISTHICFLSDNPQADLEKIKRWAEEKNVKFKQGEWSKEMLWFDLPDVFGNFVIEIMNTSVIKSAKNS